MNFGITDLRGGPEPRRWQPFDALMDDGSDRAIHSAKDRSTAPFADEARIMAVHAAHLCATPADSGSGPPPSPVRLRRGDDGEAAGCNGLRARRVRVCGVFKTLRPFP